MHPEVRAAAGSAPRSARWFESSGSRRSARRHPRRIRLRLALGARNFPARLAWPSQRRPAVGYRSVSHRRRGIGVCDLCLGGAASARGHALGHSRRQQRARPPRLLSPRPTWAAGSDGDRRAGPAFRRLVGGPAHSGIEPDHRSRSDRHVPLPRIRQRGPPRLEQRSSAHSLRRCPPPGSVSCLAWLQRSFWLLSQCFVQNLHGCCCHRPWCCRPCLLSP
jgi:hypothetical protein